MFTSEFAETLDSGCGETFVPVFNSTWPVRLQSSSLSASVAPTPRIASSW